MGCACENKKRMADIAKMRSLARKAAKMERKVYILYEKGGVFNFCPRGEMLNFIQCSVRFCKRCLKKNSLRIGSVKFLNRVITQKGLISD